MPMEIHEDKIIMRAGKYDLPKPWQGLTDEDRVQIKVDANFNQFMTVGEYADRIQQLTEAKLKEKNAELSTGDRNG